MLLLFCSYQNHNNFGDDVDDDRLVTNLYKSFSTNSNYKFMYCLIDITTYNMSTI